MSRERSIKQHLKQIYIQLCIRRGIKEKKLSSLLRECTHLEDNLKPQAADHVAEQAVNYLDMEEPGWGSHLNSS